MARSSILTVFGEQPEARSPISSVAVSVLVHAGFFSLLSIRLFETHRILERFPTQRFAVRFVDFHSIERQIAEPVEGGVRAEGGQKRGSQGGSAGSPAVTRLTPSRMPASQTLIQPDIEPRVTIAETTPVPLVVLWTPEKAVVRRVVPAHAQAASIAVVQPSLDAPIKEDNLSDLELSSSALVTQGPAARPSTTSPIVVAGPEKVKKVPQTTSQQADPPTPARVISLSDLRVAEGKVAVPVANQTAKASPGSLIPGQLKKPAPVGDGFSTAEVRVAGTGEAVQKEPGKEDGASGKSGDGAGSNPGAAIASSGVSQRIPAGSGVAAQPGTQASVRISLPRDGQFGVVVLGSSVADQYPETAEMWSGRMAATVYLHVGTAKSWILQYALPRLAQAQGGGPIDAPWPYEMARPRLDAGDVELDAVILHGFVNKDGRFDKLEVVFPAQLAQAPEWVLALNQWQFRPAKQGGEAVPVEVLLIVPDPSD